MLHLLLWLSLVEYAISAPIRFTFPFASRARLSGRNLVVFGDSFSDDGHGAWVYSNGTWPADPAYYGHHFSNGPVWPQLIAKENHLNLHDFAVGGATSDNDVVQGYTGPDSTIPVPSAQDQIDIFLRKNPVLQDSDIFVVFIGANDAFFSENVTGSQIAGLVADQVAQLYNSGARTILLPSYPSLATLPFAFTQPAIYQTFLSQYTEELKAGLYRISKAYQSKAQVIVIDIYRKFDQVIGNPTEYGLNPDKLHVACLQGAYNEAPRSLCDDPGRHLWFDAYHPTRVGHQIAATVFQKSLEAL